ncbi:thioesterase II family protein [Streptomyces boncukensis]|uniref:Thioesterase n=1 Tax=Streptomyces boncukensis TaxID=2711219 RepID=A0A6G4X217_9ACTN|nr:alpha/beta fold hydrolase [Streptomyces boncukensis]NGO71428.1 thioesterase [Streptomyces boncukensis]
MSTSGTTPWTPFPPPGGGKLRLFCFPCAGQGASAYRAWQRLLAPEIDAVPVQLPGREGHATAPPYTDMDALMDALLPALRGQLTERFALFGHSMGGVVAFETARRLEAEGRSPEHVFVAAQRPPRDPGDGQWELHELPHAAFMTMLGLLGQVPAEMFEDPSAVTRAADTLRADFALAETYAPPVGRRLAGPLTVLAGLADSGVPPAALRGWREWASGAFTFRPVPGDHFFVHERTEEIVGLLRSTLLTA